jgi:ABC-type spermidine/putrescine transport system permease subunit I
MSLLRRMMRRPDPLWLAIPGLAFLAVFFVYPVGSLLLLSVTDNESGAWSLVSFWRIFGSDVYVRVLGITFRIAALTALLSIVIGYPLAYWIAGRPEHLRNRTLLLVVIPFWTSYLVKTFAWMIMLGRNGVLNDILLGTGIAAEPLPLIHNEFGVLVGMVHTMVPLAVMTMLPVMISIDRRLVSAAQTLGADPAHGFWLIYFKLSLPGVTAAGLLVFISSLGFFIVPAFLGGRQQTMLAQLIIVQISELLNWSFASALAVMMLVTALVAVAVYDRLFGLSSVSGGGTSESAGRLRSAGQGVLSLAARLSSLVAMPVRAIGGGRVGRAILPAYSWFMIAFLIVPTLLVIPIAFTRSEFLEFPPPGYSLRWFETYFTSPLWLGATARSFVVALMTAILATTIGLCAALALAHTRTRWSAALFALFLAPMIVPRIVIAVGMFYLFARLGLVASNAGLVIGHTVLALPFTIVTITAVLKTYDVRLDQAAATLGANRWRTLVGVTLPIIKGGLIAALLFAFITSFDELTIAIFISGGLATTLPKQMWDDMILQLNPTLAAVSVVVFVVVTILLMIAERFRKTA